MAAVVACGAALAFGAWNVWQLRAETARSGTTILRLGARLTEVESDRAALAARVATLTRDLDEARSAPPPRVATAHDGSAPSDHGETALPTAPDAAVIRYARDLLTVHVAGGSLFGLLQEIGRQSGVRIRGEFSDGRQVSADFADVPLPEALHRLIGDQNFVLVYDDQHRPRVLELVRPPQAPHTVAPQAAAALPAVPPLAE